MIRKLILAALAALVAGPLVSLHLIETSEAGATLSVLRESGKAVYLLETRGLVRIEPLLAAAVL